MSLWTTIAAYLGATAGVASLIWQVVSWRRSGSRVVVVTRPAVLATEPPTYYFTVEARNTGRLATTVDAWGFRMPRSKGNIVDTRLDPWSTRVPYRLEPGASVDFMMRTGDVERVAAEHDVPLSRVTGWVRLGDGRERLARWPLRRS